MVLEEAIAGAGDRLTANDRQILTQLVRDRSAGARMSSSELSATLHTSRTTLGRITRKLGLKSFAELKYLLEPHKPADQDSPSLAEIAQGYRMLIQDLAKRDYRHACELISEAHTVYLYGTGNEQKALAREFALLFSSYGTACVELFDLGELRLSLRHAGSEDLLVVISLSGESQEALSVAQEGSLLGMRTLSLTRLDNNALARACDENLFVGTIVLQSDQILSYELISAFYLLLEMLALSYGALCGGEGGDGHAA